jgi:hypothetical protein
MDFGLSIEEVKTWAFASAYIPLTLVPTIIVILIISAVSKSRAKKKNPLNKTKDKKLQNGGNSTASSNIKVHEKITYKGKER